MARYLPDGRIIFVFRDMAPNSPTKGHFVAWVGTWDNIIEGCSGEYRVKLLHSYAVKTVEVEALMFPRGLSRQPYLLGAALTVLFSLAVNFALRFKLNKIEMAETLKSVE